MSCSAINNDIIQACSGTGVSADQLISNWQANDCPAVFSTYLNTGSSGFLQYNPANQANAQACVSQLFQTYQSQYTLTDDVTSSDYNTFQITLNNFCTNPSVPGVCGSFLTSYCTQPREQVESSPTLINFCGCYTTPDPNYLPITGSPVCDPLCHRTQTSQLLVQPDVSGQLNTCSQNVCVLKDIIINSVNSTSADGVSFNSECGGCGSGQGAQSCLCVVAGLNLTNTLGTIGVENLSDFCGANSQCIVEDDEGNIISSQLCSAYTFPPPVVATNTAPNYFFIIVVLVILIIAIVLVVISRVRQQ